MDSWTTVTKKKKVKKKTINKVNIKTMKTNIKKKPKLNNNVKEKILKYCELKPNDHKVFHTWKHFYIMGNILKNNKIFRNENKLLLLEYFNKYKIYKNYNKGDELIFVNILNHIKMTEEQLFLEMKDNHLYFNKILLQKHPLFLEIYNKFLKKEKTVLKKDVDISTNKQKLTVINQNLSFKEMLKKNI